MSSAVHSRLYTGTVMHARHAPTRHVFTYRMSMLYLDLDELPQVMEHGRLASASRRALMRFCRDDYLGDAGTALSAAVRAVILQRTGAVSSGPVRVLTHPRYFGFVFNPVSLYYAFAPGSERVEFVVAQITNTPWLERHSYVLDCRTQTDPDRLRFEFDKHFHISPFMPMAQSYDWQFSTPGERLHVHMRNSEDSARVFDARLNLLASPLSAANLRRAVVRYPLMTFKVVGGIYWHALRLLLKGTPFHSHPDSKSGEEART